MTRAKEKDYVTIAAGYAADVVSRRLPACQWAVKACRRQLDDLGKAKRGEFPCRFDHEKASRICRFIEMLPHIKGEWAKNGSRIELQPWQVFILTAVFGWVSRESGLRRFRIAYLEMPRKNGKGLSLNTPIPTSTGWTTMGDLSIGDTVFGTDGRPCNVTAVSQTYTDHQCYQMDFSNGESVIADAGHLWKTVAHANMEINTTGEIFRALGHRAKCGIDNPLELSGSPRSGAVRIVTVESVDPVPVKCIQVDSPDGMYLFGRTMLPTHNSTFSSGVRLYCLCLDGEEGSDVYSAATTRDQAKIVWQDAWHMVERSPGLKSTFGVSTTAHAISRVATASRFQALSAEGNSLDGLNIHCAIVDELHAHRTRKVYDVLETATGARSQPLIWNITTAGSDRSGICYEQRTYLTKVLDGIVKDETYFGIIYSIDDGDDWTGPTTTMRRWQRRNQPQVVAKW